MTWIIMHLSIERDVTDNVKSYITFRDDKEIT